MLIVLLQYINPFQSQWQHAHDVTLKSLSIEQTSEHNR